jgi:hypothetical protein
VRALRRLAAAASRRLRGVTVTALVGESGTGKSFRARLLAETRGIDLVVDDGILLHRGAILAGHWAKKESTLLAATRRALFDSPAHAEEARAALRAVRVRSVLVVGTSLLMVGRIAAALDLPRPSRIITIDEVAHAEEIKAAGRRRRREGSHAIPAPAVSVRRRTLSALAAGTGALLSALRRRTGGRRGSPAAVAWEEQARGSVSVSEDALSQMVHHCVDEHDPLLSVAKVRIRERSGMQDLVVGIRVPFGHGTAGDLHRLRDSIMHSLERHAGIVVREVRLVVEAVGDRTGEKPGTS